MYFTKKLKVISIYLLITILSINLSNALENKILFKVDNEIITTIDIYEEIRFLKIFNPEMNDLSEAELFEISKNSILRDKIKKIEIMNFVKTIKIEDKFIFNLIRSRYSNININSFEDFENYLKDKNFNVDNIREKFTIELIWNDLIYQKFNKKVVINKDKIRKEILQNPKKKNQRELLLSEITFNVQNKNDLNDRHKKILLDIEKIGFKKSAFIHSDSDTATNGGLIGWIKEDNLNKVIKKSISKLQPGQFSEPIRTSSGFMIIRIDDKKEYASNINLEDKVNEMIRYKTNNQLDQFSSMYFNKIKKDLMIYGL
tara:strand:- start:380 stop:1324 length:945 start_codon:yes stop_codon:yes gene_type:complete